MVDYPKKVRISLGIFDAFVIGFLFVMTPISKWMLKNLPRCIFIQNGIMCPGCGGTRCIREFGQGNLAASFMYNPYIFMVGIYLIVLVVLLNLGYLFNFKFARNAMHAIADYRVVIAIAIGYALFGVLRNIL